MNLIDDGLDDTTLYAKYLEEHPEEEEPNAFECIKKLLVIGTKNNTNLIWYLKKNKDVIDDDFFLKCLWLTYSFKKVEMSFCQKKIINHIESKMSKIDWKKLPDYEKFICMMIRIAIKKKNSIKFVEKPQMLSYVTKKEKEFRKRIEKKIEKERPRSMTYISWKNDKSISNFIRVSDLGVEFFYSIFMNFGKETFVYKFLKILLSNTRRSSVNEISKNYKIEQVKEVLRRRMSVTGELKFVNSFFKLNEKEIKSVLDHLNKRIESFFKNEKFLKSYQKYSKRIEIKRKRKRKIISDDHNPKRVKLNT